MSDLFVPKNPVNIAIRPLDKGMILNMPPSLIPKGAAVTEKNLWIVDGALQRRPGLAQYLLTSAMQDVVMGGTTLWSIGGNIYNVHWDRRFVYDGAGAAFVPKYWTHTPGNVKYTATKLTVFGVTAGVSWAVATHLIRAGDYIRLSSGTAAEVKKILAIVSGTQLTVDSAITGTSASTTYELRRAFQASDPFILDYCVADNMIVFADGSRPLYKYTGTGLSRFVTCPVQTSVFNWRPRCVAYFSNRMWAANTLETNTHRQRIRWSLVTNHAEFRDASDLDTQWLDLPYSSGQIMKLLPLGNMLMIYLDDCIYSGMPTNMPTLPITPQRIETGGIGLVGQKAICSFMGSHYWVGQDDIYTMQTKGIERIGTPIIRETLKKCTNVRFIQVAPDPVNSRIVFAFPESGTSSTKLWSYFYKSNSWTYDDVGSSSVDFVGLGSLLTWDTTTETWDTVGASYSSWDTMLGSGSLQGKLLIGQTNGRVYSFSSDGSTDAQVTPAIAIPILLESGDIDLDEPDDQKTWLRLGAKLREAAPVGFSFEVFVSINRGNVWKSVGNLTIASGEDESYVNFRAVGSQMRFKLVSAATVAPYAIQEITLRVRAAGLETKSVAT